MTIQSKQALSEPSSRQQTDSKQFNATSHFN